MADVTRHQSVLEHTPSKSTGSHIAFDSRHDAGEDPTDQLLIDEQLWEDLGKPETISIRVLPGEQLED